MAVMRGQILGPPKAPSLFQSVCQPPIMLMKAKRGHSIRQVGSAMRRRGGGSKIDTNGLGERYGILDSLAPEEHSMFLYYTEA